MCPRELDILSIASINQRRPRLTIVSYSSQEISKSNSDSFNRLRTRIFRTIAVPLAVAASILSIELAHGDNSSPLPRPDHIVLVIEENHAYSQIINSPDAPYTNRLATQGALFTQSFGLTHPSQPNYLALFSGSTQGITDNSCSQTFTTPNLGHALLAKGLTFAGYSEDLPAIGALMCSAEPYARKHNPWVKLAGQCRQWATRDDQSTHDEFSGGVQRAPYGKHRCAKSTERYAQWKQFRDDSER